MKIKININDPAKKIMEFLLFVKYNTHEFFSNHYFHITFFFFVFQFVRVFGFCFFFDIMNIFFLFVSLFSFFYVIPFFFSQNIRNILQKSRSRRLFPFASRNANVKRRIS